MKDEDLYPGLDKKELRGIKKEVAEKYDPKIVAEANKRVRAMTKARWVGVKAEADEICRALAAVMDLDPAEPAVQKLIARHYQHLGRFYEPTLELYRGLGVMYAGDPRFRSHYDKYKKGLAVFLSKGISIFCSKQAFGEGRF